MGDNKFLLLWTLLAVLCGSSELLPASTLDSNKEASSLDVIPARTLDKNNDATSYSTCTKTGESHYTTFDGHKFDFMGTSVYQLVGLVSKDPSLTAFTVTVQNDNQESSTVLYTKAVTLEAYGMNITLSKESPRQILVDGLLTALPLNVQTNRIMAYNSRRSVIIQTDFGLTVTFDCDINVKISLPSKFAKAVGGLCGNNNKVSSDDLTMKSGVKATSVAQFADSWKDRSQ